MDIERPETVWPVAALDQALFEPLRPLLARLPADRFPDMAELDGLASACGAPVRFIEPDTDPRYYELRIHQTGQVPTRPGHWHDLFNALVWCRFPASKRALNQRHVAAMSADDGPRRCPERDFLTVFDESGAVALCRDPALLALWREHRWRELFVEHREAVRRHLRVRVFGHAVYEKALAPFKAMTAKVLVVDAPFEADDATLDQVLAERLVNEDWRALKAESLALPVLGLPGWCPDNESPGFYEDTEVFRPRRRPGGNA